MFDSYYLQKIGEQLGRVADQLEVQSRLQGGEQRYDEVYGDILRRHFEETRASLDASMQIMEQDREFTRG
jgi:hypothetical protein